MLYQALKQLCSFVFLFFPLLFLATATFSKPVDNFEGFVIFTNIPLSSIVEFSISLLCLNLSGGEKQRIGIARAFLHNGPLILLDEPTSNLDSLNEGIILKSLKEECKDKTVVLVSHRKSTMNITDILYKMKEGRFS